MKTLFKKSNIFLIVLGVILSGIAYTGACEAGENVVRTIQINYPSKSINGSTTVVAVPGCQYTFTVVGTLPQGTHIEWKNQSTTKGSWSTNVLYPYETGGGSGSYSITAVLVGGEGGEGPGWQVTVSGSITDPILTFSEPGEDKYFAKDQTDPVPQANLKVTVTKPGGTQLEGVSVKFVADKSDSSKVTIGSATSNSSGEASKSWTVPVSAAETFTLKAGTGNNYNDLENEATCSYKVYILEVESLLPDEGIEIDDEDGDPNTKTFVVQYASTGNITVTATPNPNIAEADLPAEWTLTGGTGTGKLTRTISKTTTSKTVLTCTYGSSFKTTTVYVYNAQFKCWSAAGVVEPPPLGHAWWELSIDPYTKELLVVKYKKQLDLAGYFPTVGELSPGEVKYGNDAKGGHLATGSHWWKISFDELKNALQKVKNLEANPGIWEVFVHNCADEACYVGEAGGVRMMDTSGFTTPYALSNWLNNQQ